jgi:ketosteroid isomerase-like protein
MSQENIEIVRAMFEANSAGDMDAFRELHDPDVIMRTPKGHADVSTTETYIGEPTLDELRTAIEGFRYERTFSPQRNAPQSRL